MGDFASLKILEVHGKRMIMRAFARGFPTGLHQKDRMAMRRACHPEQEET